MHALRLLGLLALVASCPAPAHAGNLGHQLELWVNMSLWSSAASGDYWSDTRIGYVAEIAGDEVAHTARDLVLGTGFEEEQSALDEAIAAWARNGISHYEFVLQTSCFCPPETTAPGLVEVSGGEIVGVVDPDTGMLLDPANYRTVGGLFDVVQSAIDQDVFQLTAAYDPLGYPVQIFTDSYEFVADDTIGFTASKLVDLPEPRAVPLAVACLCTLQILARQRRLSKSGFRDQPRASTREACPRSASSTSATLASMPSVSVLTTRS